MMIKFKSAFLYITCVAAVVALTACSSPTSTSTPTTTSTTAQNPGPWPGVPVYGESSSPIRIRVNDTFSIVLPPAPLSGWGWQNSDLDAFQLLETKTVPGPANEPNTFGPNAFLFKALKQGTFQIILYVPSKPPQQLERFDVVVNS